jgi:hypothetical protein
VNFIGGIAETFPVINFRIILLVVFGPVEIISPKAELGQIVTISGQN